MRRSGKILLGLGVLLVALSLVLLILMQMKIRQAEHDNARIVQTMETILTDRKAQTQDPNWTAPMPALELQGEDYIALLEIPAYGLKLPVGKDWGRETVMSHPCRFCGTAYNGSLVIGGYDQPGQFDFFDRIDQGVMIIVTDMAGNRFSYVVDRVERSKSAEAAVLMDDGADLTLFVRDSRHLEYIILRCLEK